MKEGDMNEANEREIMKKQEGAIQQCMEIDIWEGPRKE